jgi:hypothetical protein
MLAVRLGPRRAHHVLGNCRAAAKFSGDSPDGHTGTVGLQDGLAPGAGACQHLLPRGFGVHAAFRMPAGIASRSC